MSCKDCVHSTNVPLEYVKENIGSEDPEKIAKFRAEQVDCYFDDTLEMVHVTEAERCEDYVPKGERPTRTIDEIRAKLVFLGKKRESAPNTRSRVYIRAIAQIKILRWLLGTELE